MKEMEAKEIQGITEVGEVAGDNNALEKGTRQTSLPSAEGLSLMKEKERCFLRERRAICQVAGDNHASEKSTRQTASLSIWGFFLMRKMEAPLSPFLALMQEKEAKENQGIRDACQVCRIP